MTRTGMGGWRHAALVGGATLGAMACGVAVDGGSEPDPSSRREPRPETTAVPTTLPTDVPRPVPDPRDPEPVDPDEVSAECDTGVTAEGFDVAVEWDYTPAGEARGALAMPVVANLLGDGTPEVVLNLYERGDYFGPGHLIVLDGATGTELLRIDDEVVATSTPALGDVDGDGEVEIVAFGPGVTGRVLLFDADGTLLWRSEEEFFGGQFPPALADLDADGDVEIVVGSHVIDHTGKTVWSDSRSLYSIDSAVAVDLDGDGFLEVVRGMAAFRHDGSVYYDHGTLPDPRALVSVADIDGDEHPEVVLHTWRGPGIVEHDGTLSRPPPTDDNDMANDNPCWWSFMPGAIADLDGDGHPDLIGVGHYAVCTLDGALRKQALLPVREDGHAGVTAFDFLGDGHREIVQGDNRCLRILDHEGRLLWARERPHVTQVEVPVVVDVDGDGKAELLVVGNEGYGQHPDPGEYSHPALRVYGADGWAPARAIWNQHTYHSTNVADDGTIPQHEAPHYLRNNSFRVMETGPSLGDP